MTPGTPSVFPLEIALGVIGGRATPALGDVVGRLSAELTQSQTRAVLAERFGVRWSVGTLRKVTAALAEELAPLRHETQLAQVLQWLDNAAKSQGKHAVTLVVGRDGVMLPSGPRRDAQPAARQLPKQHRLGKPPPANLSGFRRLALAREPAVMERDRAVAFLGEFAAGVRGTDPNRRAGSAFCQALLAGAEFRYLD